MTARHVPDPATLPRCHRCGAPARVDLRHPRMPSVTWRHEHDCSVPDSIEERARLAMALALALDPGRIGGAL
jgi:hypothetical protein